MRIEDAPPAGWYPDPEGGSRLRWWQGTDWSDRYRSRPADARTRASIDEIGSGEGAHRWVPDDPRLLDRSVDTQVVVDQVRLAARQEAERAAELFGAQARHAALSVQPLITQYTTKVSRLFRWLAIIAIVVALAWVAFQVIVQESMFQWIGDRIDNLTNRTNDDSGFMNPFVT